jgi:hypothetical protein
MTTEESVQDDHDPKLKDTFWLDGWEGECQTGFYYRNNIGQAIEDFEKKSNRKVVGITLDREGWNAEFILEADK